MDGMDEMDILERRCGIIILTGIWGCENLPESNYKMYSEGRK